MNRAFVHRNDCPTTLGVLEALFADLATCDEYEPATFGAWVAFEGARLSNMQRITLGLARALAEAEEQQRTDWPPSIAASIRRSVNTIYEDRGV